MVQPFDQSQGVLYLKYFIITNTHIILPALSDIGIGSALPVPVEIVREKA
jgi:hypothetical protein